MRRSRVLVLFEPGRGGNAALDYAGELATSEHAELTVVGVAPRAPSGARCGNSAVDFNDFVQDAVAADLTRARERLGAAGACARYALLTEGTAASLERFAADGDFDLVLLPGRRWPRSTHHPAATRLRRAARAEIRVIDRRAVLSQ